MEPYDLVCIGCGPAGEKAATQAAYFGHRVAVIEREPRPGGAMVNTGTIASKALRETALLCSALRRRPLPGVEASVDRSLSIHKLMAQRYRVQHQEHDRIEARFDEAGIEVHRGHGRIVDRNVVAVEAVDGTVARHKTRFILVATGSSPVRPGHVPFDHDRVVDADGILDLTRIPGSVVVVGGGVIGCEYACMLAEIGVRVTLVDPREVLLGWLDDECRAQLLRSMGDQGIDIRLNSAVKTVTPGDGDESPVTVELDEGETLTCEVLLWAAGRSSNTADLGLERVGIHTGNRGLLHVNEHYQTSVHNIYGAGDVIGFPALASTSMEQGRVAACHMFDIDFKRTLSDNLPFGLYTIPAISTVGIGEKEAAEKGLDVVVGRALYRLNARGRMLGDEAGLVKCVFDAKTRKLLGAAIVGQDATELIHLAQLIIGYDGVIDDLISACFNYPSLSELYKYAAYDALQAMGKMKHVQAA